MPSWRLALVTIVQLAEGLSDRQAAATVRSRIDWKYLLRLDLADPGFDASVLSEFRTRLLAGSVEFLLFDTLLVWVRALNRVELVGETMRHALNDFAVVAPAWLREVT